MAMISLRDYHREIESLIESNQNDEAIFHCMVILQTFPKCIETYRNLGKSLLESKRFTEASEVFSKILTVFPDDFIAHVGLSVIREEERDLDAAIWHMEQAFELQPSNLAIQEELRRLFGRRDGVPPVKIRLTRGALVKMYARGELHQQAIAEIKSVLKDEPSRLDYKVLLAKMYYVSGSHTEAIEIASEIIEKYPYCFEANKVLDELLGSSGNNDNVNIYRERLVSLDPYYRFVDALTTNIVDVPADKITFEKKIFTGSADHESNVPDWTKQIGLNWKESDNFVSSEPVDLLDQVKSFDNKAREPISEKIVSPFIGDFRPDIDKSESDSNNETEPLPDWIANAGWTRAAEDSDMENEFVGDSESNEQDDAQAEPSQELPDWLKSLTPADEPKKTISYNAENTFSPDNDQSESDTLGSESSSEELPDWLSSLGANEDSSEKEFASDEQKTVPNQSSDFDEFDNSVLSSDEFKHAIDNWNDEDVNPVHGLAENLLLEEQTEKESSPDWLNQIVDDNLNPIEEKSEESLPDWLRNFDSEDLKSPPDNDEPPDWLSSLQGQDSEAEQVSIEQGSLDSNEVFEPDSKQNIDDFLDGIKSEQPVEDTADFLRNLSGSAIPPIPDKEEEKINNEVFDSQLQSDAGSDQKPPVPSWVKNILSSSPSTTPDTTAVEPQPASTAVPASSTTHPKDEEEIEPLISDLPDQSEHIGAISGESNDELISWLRDVNPEDGDLENTIPAISEMDSEKTSTPFDEEISLESLLSEDLPDLSIAAEEEILEPPLVEMSTSSLENRLSDLLQQPLDENISAEEIEDRQDLSEMEVKGEEEQLVQNESFLSDLLEEIQHPVEDIPSTMVEEPLETNRLEQIMTLLESGDHSAIPSLIDNSIESGLPVEAIIESFESLSQKQSNSYEFWQELGDLYLSKSDLDNALKAYNTAAGILQI